MNSRSRWRMKSSEILKFHGVIFGEFFFSGVRHMPMEYKKYCSMYFIILFYTRKSPIHRILCLSKIGLK